MKTSKAQAKLITSAAVMLEEVASSVVLSRPVKLGLADMGQFEAANGLTREEKDGSLLVVLDRRLLTPSFDTCKQAIWHVILHEMAHCADWDRLQTGGRSAHDAHWGIEYAKTYCAGTKA